VRRELIATHCSRRHLPLTRAATTRMIGRRTPVTTKLVPMYAGNRTETRAGRDPTSWMPAVAGGAVSVQLSERRRPTT